MNQIPKIDRTSNERIAGNGRQRFTNELTFSVNQAMEEVAWLPFQKDICIVMYLPYTYFLIFIKLGLLDMVARWQCPSAWLPDMLKLHVNTCATIYHIIIGDEKKSRKKEQVFIIERERKQTN